MNDSQLAAILLRSQSEILAEWIAEQAAADVARPGAARQSDLQRQCTEFLDLLVRVADGTRRQRLTEREPRRTPGRLLRPPRPCQG